jgi:hypothetical protein
MLIGLKINMTQKNKIQIFGPIVLTALIGWAVFLHIYRFTEFGALWRDEISSVSVASEVNWKDFYYAQTRDSFPLLNVLLLKGWMSMKDGTLQKVATNDKYLRFFGLISGLGLVSALVWCAVIIFRSFPVFSLSLFALSPTVIKWGDSLRAYALGAALSIVFLGFIWRFLERQTFFRWLACVTTAIFMVWTLYGNAFFVLSICVGSLMVALLRKNFKLFFLLCGIGLLSAFSICLNIPIINRMSILKDITSQYITFPSILQSWWMTLTESGVWVGVIWLVATFLGLAIAASHLIFPRGDSKYSKSRAQDTRNQRKKNKHSRASTAQAQSNVKASDSFDKNSIYKSECNTKELSIFIFTTLMVSIVGFIIYLKIVDIPPQTWYWIPIGAVIVASLDALWPLIQRSPRVVALQIVLAVGIPLLTGHKTWQSLKEQFSNMDDVAAIMEKRAKAEDLIFVAPLYQASSFLRYYDGPARVQVWPPHNPEQLTYQRVDVLLDAINSKDEAMPPLLEDVGRVLRAGGKVWLLGDIVVVPGDRPPPHVPPGTKFPQQSLIGPYLYSWGAQ